MTQKHPPEILSAQEGFPNAQDILMDAPIGIFISTPEGRFISVNPALARMYGYDSPDELIESITDIATQVYADPEDRKEFLRLLEEHGEVVNHECRFRQRDGAIFWVSRNARAIRDQTGAIIYYQGFTTDISARKQTDDGLREQTQRLNSITENMFDMVSITDLEGNYTYLAPSHAILGYDLDALIGANVMEHVHPDDYQAVATAFAGFLANREDGRKVEYRYRRVDGSYLWLETVGKFIHDEHGNPEKILFSTRDFTARKQAEEALEKRLVALTQPLDSSEWFDFDQLFSIAELQRLQDDFAKATNVAALITHPDGTPITAPTNFCRLCEIIRKTEIGHANCIKSDSELGRMNPGGPSVQPCLSGGLWDAGAAIYVGDRHIANWLIGQVRDEGQGEEKIRAYARTIGVDEDVAAEAFREVPAMSRQQFEQIANALFTFATQLSNSAYQNLQQARFITDRKRTEQALRESEQRLIQEVEQRRYAETYLDTILNAVPDPVFVKDMNHRWIRLNEAFCAFMGRSGEELLGKSDYEFFPREEADVFWEKDKLVFETGECNISEEYFTDLNGMRHVISTKKTLLTMPDTGEKLLVGVIRDITDRKLTENALRESEERFKALHNASFGGIAIHDKGIILECNHGLSEISGLSYDELIGMDGLLLIAEKSREVVMSNILAGHEKPYEAFGMRKNGEVYPLRLEARNIPYKGNMVRVVEFRDITEQKRAEEALQESEARFRNLFENVPAVAVQGYGMDGITLFWNRASEEFYGFSPDEAIGKNLVDLIIPTDMRQDVIREMKGMSESGVPIPSAELQLKRKDGSHIQVYSSHAIIQKPNQLPELFCIDIDLTDLKRAEQALIQAKEQAEAANQAKSEFLANMSHEIRTPINGIMGMMQLLETTPLDVDQQQYVTLCKTSANRLTRLLSDILDLSRVEAGKMDIFEAEFKVQDVGDSVSDLFTVTARNKGVYLECAIDPDMPVQLIGDEARVRQVLFNLVGNALKFTKQGNVRLEMTSLGTGEDDVSNVLFTVSDTGIGIPDDKLDGLFKPFVQVDGSYTRSFQGAGLGLAIVKRLVDLMGGKISMQSTVGEGTTVQVFLPFKLPRRTSIPAEQDSRQSPQAGQSLRILLAEDEPSNALPIMKLLEKAGHTVTLAEDGQQVLDLLKTQDFDVILMDVQMPVMNGVEATRRIRATEVHGSRGEVHGSRFNGSAVEAEDVHGIGVGAHRGAPDGVAPNAIHSDYTPTPTVNREPLNREPHIPIIALTAYAMLGDREKFLEAGMNDYLAKPVRMDDLAKVLDRVTSIARA